jgi:hypothetical protein
MSRPLRGRVWRWRHIAEISQHYRYFSVFLRKEFSLFNLYRTAALVEAAPFCRAS